MYLGSGLSVLVYGAITLIVTVRARGLRRAVAIGIGAGMVLTIAASRLLLEIHSLPEVSLGVVIGMVSLILFGSDLSAVPAGEGVAAARHFRVLIALLHGQELHAEEFLHRVTGYLRVHCR
jgi:hypothetical protein